MKSSLLVPVLGVVAVANVSAAGVERDWIVRFAEPSIVERAQQAGVPVREALAKSSTLVPLKRAVQQAQASRLQDLQQVLGRPLQPSFVYEYALNGVAVRLSDDEAARLATLSGVQIEPDQQYKLHTDAGPRWVGASAVWAGETGLSTRGEGVVIGVIDTGIAAAHPSFAVRSADGYTHVNPRGQRFGLCLSQLAQARCNDKLIGIHDLTQEGARDGSDINGHGTHVASIAAGNPFTGNIRAQTTTLTLQLSGVAPRANLISYKACTNETASGSCAGSAVLAAINQAVADGVDVINYSIGGGPRSPWGSGAADAAAMLGARAAGIVVVASAGNEGPLPGSMGSPANAPWVLAAANTSHDRVFETELTDLSGSAPPRISFKGQSISAGTAGNAAIVLGENRGSALCSSGSDLDFPPSGISNPFAAGSLNGLIVVCERGVQARVAKGNNVRLGGGVGMVLMNTAADGESVVADDHALPSTHLGASAGGVLKSWLQRAPDARGRITATRAVSDPGLADVLSSSSSRGPDAGGSGVLKPNLSAPGSGIQAAHHASSGFVSLSGTSMSAPHIAGAAALVKAARPNWSADRIVSALLLSADDSLVRDSDGSAATPLHTGSGRLQVQRAILAGLTMAQSAGGFTAANPAQGGSPASLNLPEIYSEACRSRCSFVREFEAQRAASWEIEAVASHDVLVSAEPARFTLAAGQRQSVRFSVDVTAARAVGQLSTGKVLLRPVGESATAVLSLPLVVRSDATGLAPAAVIDLATTTERGTLDYRSGALVGLSGAHYRLLGPALPRVEQLVLGADSDDVFDAFAAATGTHLTRVQLTGERRALVAIASANADVDLYVGADRDGDGLAGVGEVLCAARSAAQQERCVLHDLDPGQYWILLHNPSASSSRSVQLQYALLAETGHVSGPAQVAEGSSADLRLSHDLSSSTAATGTHLGALLAYAGFAVEQPFAAAVVRLDKRAGQTEAPVALLEGQTLQVRVPANASIDPVWIDSSGAGVVVLESDAPVQVSLLRGQVLPVQAAASVEVPATAQTLLSLQGIVNGNLELSEGAYRHHLRLSNSSSSPVRVSLHRPQPSLTASASTSIAPGVYYDSARPGHGLFISRARDELQLAWYTYDHQGEPTFYLGFADAAFSGAQLKPSVSLSLYRYSWDGSRALGQVVGTGNLHALGSQGLQWTWTLDQRSGSEPMQRLLDNDCVEVAGRSLDLSGLWFNPQQPGYGASVLSAPGTEIYAIYLYDGSGRPRWLWSDEGRPGQPGSALYQYTGFCPGCAYQPASRTAVGTLQRSYGPDLSMIGPGIAPSGSWTIDSAVGSDSAPRWRSSGPLQMLTQAGICR